MTLRNSNTRLLYLYKHICWCSFTHSLTHSHAEDEVFRSERVDRFRERMSELNSTPQLAQSRRLPISNGAEEPPRPGEPVLPIPVALARDRLHHVVAAVVHGEESDRVGRMLDDVFRPAPHKGSTAPRRPAVRPDVNHNG